MLLVLRELPYFSSLFKYLPGWQVVHDLSLANKVDTIRLLWFSSFDALRLSPVRMRVHL